MNMTREMPHGKYPFLRVQAGRWETRPEQVALYLGKSMIGYREGSKQVSVFRLLGWGTTRRKAERMAQAVDLGKADL